MSDASAGDGTMSIDAAVAAMDAAAEPVEQEAPAAEPDAPEPEPDPDEPEQPEPEAGDDEDPEPDAEPEPEAQAEPVEPPPFWSADEKALFAELPPHLQLKVRAREDASSKAVAQAFQRSAEATKAAQAEAAKLAELTPKLQALAEQAVANLEAPVPGLVDAEGRQLRWRDVPWAEWFAQDPAAAATWRAKYDFETSETQRAIAAKQIAETKAQEQAFGAYVQEQGQALASLNPTLATSAETRQAVGEYLIKQGYPPEALRGVSALDLHTAHKAMLYDQLQAKAQQAPKPGQVPKKTVAPSRSVKPSAAVPAVPSQKRAAAEAANRFAQTGSIDDAVAALNARGSG